MNYLQLLRESFIHRFDNYVNFNSRNRNEKDSGVSSTQN